LFLTRRNSAGNPSRRAEPIAYGTTLQKQPHAMKTLLLTLLTLATLSLPGQAQTSGGDSRIHVRPAQIVSPLSPWMYGACIEDVNHEIYGGLYAQRLFGESFEEPPVSPLAGWIGYGGEWRFREGALTVGADSGAKLVRALPLVADGSVACDLRFEDARGDNAGLILRVSDPHTGPDRWIGYEISLSVRNQSLILGRHRNNWEPLRSVPVRITPGRWYRLRAELAGSTLRLFLDDSPAPLLEYNDGSNALLTGQVGLRTWNSNAAFRHLTIAANGQTVSDRLDATAINDGIGAVSGMWDPIATGSAQARFAWDSKQAYNTAHSQQITYAGGSGTVGIANRGLNRWGISVRQGQPMQGHLYVRGIQGAPPLTVALQNADGTRTYARQRLAFAGTAWTRRDFLLRPTVTDPNARFALWLSRPGSVGVDQVTLTDTGKALFHGRPFRADIGAKLVEEGLTFLRYGGTMVNVPEYRWKKMIGPRDQRPQYRGNWYPFSTNGFGIEEFLQFCEAARIEPAFAINIDETPEDAADLVEYINGPATSAWGAKRAANGHPAPYNVHYIEIGNEEGLDGSQAWYRRYLQRFQLLYAAMRPRDPRVNYVIAAWWNPEEPYCKQIAQALNGKAALWDVHVDGDNLRDADRVDRTLTQMQRLFGEWMPGSSMRACIFEENGNRHDMQRALGHARILNVTQRHGDFVRMDCPANCLQPLGQNDNGWNQGQVFFLPDRVWGMPPYFAQQMAARNHLPLCVACDTESPNEDLDVTATRGRDGRTLVLKVVNSGSQPHYADIRLEEFMPASHAEIWTLSGDLNAVNSPDAPERVRPAHTVLNVPGSKFATTFPPYSYTVLRLHAR